MKAKFFSLKQIAQMTQGEIISGADEYPLNGLTAIWSAKENEITVLETAHDVGRLTHSVRAVVCQKELKGFVLEKIPNIIVVDDAKQASCIMVKAFSDLFKA